MGKFFGRLFSFWIPNIALVVGLVVLIRYNLTPLAFALLVISKWQLLLGSPKLWARNIRASGCELIVSFSALIGLVLFSDDHFVQVGVAIAYAIWLLIIKPLTGPAWVALQAGICQLVGLSIIFLLGRAMPQAAVIGLSWLVSVTAADHFLSAHKEPAHTMLMLMWGLIATEMSWLLWHWLIVYSLLNGRVLVPQAPLIISILGYSIGSIYLDHIQKKLRKRNLFEYVIIGAFLLAIIIVGTKWDTRL